jgi:hypothetical protein
VWILLLVVGAVITGVVGWGLADFANNFGPPGKLESGIVLALFGCSVFLAIREGMDHLGLSKEKAIVEQTWAFRLGLGCWWFLNKLRRLSPKQRAIEDLFVKHLGYSRDEAQKMMNETYWFGKSKDPETYEEYEEKLIQTMVKKMGLSRDEAEKEMNRPGSREYSMGEFQEYQESKKLREQTRPQAGPP